MATKIQYRNHVAYIGDVKITSTNNDLLRRTEAAAVSRGMNYDDHGYRWYEITDEQAAALLAHEEAAAAKFREWQNRPRETVKCDCGHECEKKMVMSASRGTSCPECYDRMSS
jgi:hypothetical protein